MEFLSAQVRKGEEERGGRGKDHGSEFHFQSAWCGVCLRLSAFCLHCPREVGEFGMNRRGLKRAHKSVSSESYLKCCCRMVIVLKK